MDIQQIIKERYKELPADIQQAIQSTDLAGKFDTIAKKHSLHVDQNGALQTETLLVMLGLEPTKNFIDNVQRELEISRGEAIALAEDINSEILYSIRESLRKMEESQETDEYSQSEIPSTTTPNTSANNTTISDIEKAGDFTVEKQETIKPSPYNDSNLDREKVLKEMENVPITPIDHLLTTPTASSPNLPKDIQKDIPKTPATNDPYREPI